MKKNLKARRRTVIQQFGGKCTARHHSRVWKNTFVAFGIHTSKKQKNFKRMKSYIQANMNFSPLAQLSSHFHYTVPPRVTAKLSWSHWGGPSSPSKGMNGTMVCLVELLDPPGSIHPQAQPQMELRTLFIPFTNWSPGPKQPYLVKPRFKIFPFYKVIKKTPKNKTETKQKNLQYLFQNYTKQEDMRTAKGQVARALPGCQRPKPVNIYLGRAVQFSRDRHGVLREVSDLLRTYCSQGKFLS